MFLLGVGQTIAIDRLRIFLQPRRAATRWAAILLSTGAATTLQTLFDLHWIRLIALTFLPEWQAWALLITPQRMFTVGIIYLWTYCLALTIVWASRIRGDMEASAARAATAEAAAARAEASLHRAEAAALRLQLNPHFLFNSLNSISSLVLVDRKEEAEEMIERLCDFLRASLNADPMADVPLAQEIDSIDAYLGVEAVRFGGRLKIEMDIQPGTAEAQVPNFILQPLVENAIKHGVAAARGLARLKVSAAREGETLVLGVLNSAPSEDDDALDHRLDRRQGIGLLNIRQRLDACYGDRARLDTRRTANGYQAVIRLPFALTARSAPPDGLMTPAASLAV